MSPTRRAMLVWLAAVPVACRVRPSGAPTKRVSGGEILVTRDGEVDVGADDPQRGPNDAPCVLVTFSDFQCPFCRDMANDVDRLLRERKGAVRHVFKHLPLPKHADARRAAVAAQAAHFVGGASAFFRVHDQAFAHPAEIDGAHLEAWAVAAGVDRDAWASRLADAERKVDRDRTLAAKLGIDGTPHWYLNARSFSGRESYEHLYSQVDDVL